MDRWEFCFVDLLNHVSIRLTPTGMERTKFKRDKGLDNDSKDDATARGVARLGLEGWEMTNGVGDVRPVLFFKRRLP
jgi:D-alanyl-D-alanine carboxypeptidase